MMAKVWRCPKCGLEVLDRLNEVEYGDIWCDTCDIPLEPAGDEDIVVKA